MISIGCHLLPSCILAYVCVIINSIKWSFIMSIHALHSKTSEFKGLADRIGEIIQVSLFDDDKALLLSLDESDGILLDLDTDTKKVEKIIRSIRKSHEGLPIIVLCNGLEPKKLQKHQKSKSAADIYFTYPTDIEVIRMMMEEVFSSSSSEDTRTVALEILKEHSEKSLSSKAQIASDKLDNVFSSSFFGEYSDRKAEEMKKKESKSEVDTELEDIELDATVGGLDLSVDEELSLGEASSEDEHLGLDLSEDVGLDLGDENIELSIGEEEVEELDLGEESSLDLGGLDEGANIDLSLGDEEVESNDISDNDDDGGLDLGALNLGGESVELSLGDDEPVPTESSDSDEGLSLSLDEDEDAHTFSMDLGEAGLTDPSDPEELEFGVNDEPLDTSVNLEEEVPTLEAADDLGEISLSDDETSESQMFDLGKEDNQIEEDSLDLGSVDEEISLGDEDSDDMAMDLGESISLSEDEEELKATDDLDEFDVTRPILQSELDEIMVSEDGERGDSDSEILEGVSQLEDSHDENDTILGMNLSETTGNDSLLDSISINDDEDDEPNPLSDIQTKMMEIDAMLKGEDLSSEDEPNELPETPAFMEESLEANTGGVDLDIGFTDEGNAEVDSSEIEQVQVSQKITPAQTQHEPVSSRTLADHKEYQQSHDIELVRLGETIKALREDREKLLGKVTDLEGKFNSDKTDFIDLKAELDEKKIEIAIVKKRFTKQIDELNLQLDLLANKKEVLQEQNRIYETEFEKIRREKKIDVSKVRSRERELEEKLDLLKNDAEVQIRNRDHKILDLKRRIDTLEFDVESAQIKERKIVTNQQAVEEKMNNVIKTLRTAIGHLEDESSLEERKRLIKKNLDV